MCSATSAHYIEEQRGGVIIWGSELLVVHEVVNQHRKNSGEVHISAEQNLTSPSWIILSYVCRHRVTSQ